MKLILLLITVIVLFKSGTNGLFITKIQDQYVDNGETIYLSCSASAASVGTTMTWIQRTIDGTSLGITHNEQILIPQLRNRYSIRNTGSSTREHMLTIRNAQLDDAGEWTCTAYPESGDIDTMSTKVTVLTPPEITTISSPPVDLRLGLNYTLQCNATGSPMPIIKWRRVNPQYLPNYKPFSVGYLYNLTRVTANHRGLYECIASNGIGKAARESVKITFSYKPEVKAVREELVLPKNEAGNISCSCEAFPKVTRESDVRWYKGSQLISSSDTQNYLMDVVDDRESDRTVAILTIRNVTSTRGGEYRCRFRNQQGETERSLSVTVGAIADRYAGKVPSGASTVTPPVIISTVFMIFMATCFH
ncbi:neuronal growth regulator 1-like [Antedon mediterranea]|uniref:neuronal growth regulator 1-like n=1 Tax=Antedon mediterranea TaxID=105859 RepID=UPI003AF6CDC3